MEATAAEVQRRLLAWYDEAARDLPWRREPSLYRTVVSEFMLQQTQVTTVLPYFERWLAVFPDFAALAAAPIERVLKQWEGLGYYRRARSLHATAQQWVTLPTERKPMTAEAWRQFPGVGPYMAAAVASICFGEPVAVVDGNVVRVLARLTGEDREFRSPAQAVTHFRPQANALIAGGDRPGDFNQAMMELGATLCRKTAPQCLLCPLQKTCVAATADPAAIPRWRRSSTVARTVERAVVLRGEPAAEVMLMQVPETARRLGGLWEFPRLAELPLSAKQRRQIVKRGPSWEQKRGIANERLTEPFFVFPAGPWAKRLPDGVSWQPVGALAALPLTGPHRKVVNGPLAGLLATLLT